MADLFLKPEEAIDVWDVRPGDKIADFGSGAGFFSVPLGQRVGPNGKIYALDIRPEALEATRAKVKLFHLFNIEPQRADLELPRGSGIRDESLDKVLISNILFQAQNKNAVAQEAYRILRKGGILMVVEWSENSSGGGPASPPASPSLGGSQGGPSMDHRVGKDEAKTILTTAGFSLYKEFSAGSHHYGLIFNKQ